jgi:hypothetical protein
MVSLATRTDRQLPDGRRTPLLSGIEKRFEALANDAPNVIPYFGKTLHRDSGFTERYVEGKAALHLHLWIRPGDIEVGKEHFVAIFQRLVDHEPVLLDWPNIADWDGLERRLVMAGYGGDAGEQGSVFVFVRQLAQSAEGVSLWACRSSVLKTLDSALDFREHPSHPSLPGITGSRVIRAGHEQGKSGAVGVGRRFAFNEGAQLNEPTGQVVESRPGVVQEVADDDRHFNRRFVEDFDVSRKAAGLHIYMTPVAMGFAVKEGWDLRIESAQMFVRPVQLGEDPI